MHVIVTYCAFLLHLFNYKNVSQRAKARPKAREPPVGPAASYPPAALRCSTLGDGGLNCRVRNGSGCAPSSMVAGPTGGSRVMAGTLAACIAGKQMLLGPIG